MLFKHLSLGHYFLGCFFFRLLFHHVASRASPHIQSQTHAFGASSSTCLFIGQRICYIQGCFLRVHYKRLLLCRIGVGALLRMGLDSSLGSDWTADGISSIVIILTTFVFFPLLSYIFISFRFLPLFFLRVSIYPLCLKIVAHRFFYLYLSYGTTL